MAPSPSSHFLRNSHSPLHLITLPHKPISFLRSPKPFSLNFIRRNASRVPSSCYLHRPFSNASDFSGSVHLGVSKMKIWQMGSDYFQIQAASDGGVGGNDGFGGSDGGSSDGRSEEGGASGSQSFLSWYLMALEKHPVLTKAITSAFLTLIGDLVCQLLIDRVAMLDLKRTFVFSFLGFALVGPTLHFWYFSLSNLVTLPGASGTFLRLLLDQFLFSPIFIGVFLSALVTLEGRPSQVVPKLCQEWFSSVLANWQLWIPFQFLNFQFVPQQFQVLAANIIALVWNVILSFKAHKEILPK